jgi:subtilisin family serine protease
MVSSRLRYLSLPYLGWILLKLTGSLASNIETLFPLDFDSMPSISESDTALIQVENTSFWFVELSSLPKVEGTDASVLSSEKRQFQLNAEEAGIDYEERFAFNDLFNGFSISVDPSQLKILSTLPGVKAIFPVAVIERPEYQLIDIGNVSLPHITSALEMTGVKVAVSSLGFTGKGIKVGVMDTGIDVDHPAFGGDGTSRSNSDRFPTERVAYGYDFVGDNFSGDSTPPNPDGFPDDCGGHGTHVAGIIGANDINTGVKGVAPEVIFGAYRVFGCTGSTFADIMLAAMERALADGMDILNMSIGSSFQWPRYPTAEAASRMVEQGMVVVASIGNSGTSGLYAAGAPGVGDEVIGVASVDNANVIMKVMQVDGTDIHFVPGTGSPINPTSGSMTLTRTGTATSTNDACSAFTPDSFTAKAVLIRRGTCSFYSKAKNAENAGASAVVIYNNVAGIGFIGTVAGDPSVNIPVVFISAAEGAQLDSLIAAGSGPVTLTWTNRNGLVANPTGGLISSTSSYGPTPDLKLKPDISAPGGSILSSYPLELGG